MARTNGSKNIKTLEYVQLYDSLAEQYGCPVTALFKIALSKRIRVEHRINAAKALIPYRYPKLTGEAIQGEQGELKLVWKDGQSVG